MSVFRWRHSRRIYILVTAAVFITLWLFFSLLYSMDHETTGLNLEPGFVAFSTDTQGREPDDGEEDPDYFSDDPRRPRNMPAWFPDWIINKTLHPSALWPDPTTAHATNLEMNASNLRPPRPAILDVVYTWVNGSDPEWQYSKHFYVQHNPNLRLISGNDSKAEKFMASRFRDNNELLHSVRSTYKFGRDMVRKVHIFTADVIEESLWTSFQVRRDNGEGPGLTIDEHALEDIVRPFSPKRVGEGMETGQVPSWLDRSAATREKVDVVHHSAFFQHKDKFPIYNSAAIESQLHHFPGLSEVFIYMNDDIYFSMPMVQGDYWTPQYGMVFQVAPKYTVRPTPIYEKEKAPLERGYIDNLEFTNHQLSKRFGYRYRPHIEHYVHIASRSILEEAEALWPMAFLQSEKAQFRSDYGGHTLQSMFLLAHYTIERLRETQLRSFWRYRVDYNGNGDFEWEERWALVALIEDWTRNGDRVNQRRLKRSTGKVDRFLDGYEEVLDRTGYWELEQTPAVQYTYSGMEGFPFLILQANTSSTMNFEMDGDRVRKQPRFSEATIPPADRTCRFDLNFCLGPKFMQPQGTLSHDDAEIIFKRLAFKEYHCGDCLLQIALQSDRGVYYYYERVEDAEDDGWGDMLRQNNSTRTKKVYSQHKRGIPAILPHESIHPKARQRVLQDLYRYNYVIGESDSIFRMMDTLHNTKEHFELIEEAMRMDKPPQVVCLNDDVKEEDEDGSEMRGLLAGFLNEWYGEPSPWEKA
ncbi:hypothetical protein F5H01DRAFT_396490 [Linnemannia elongata]|nr:hypothetical protein F5H01DRAFT_396490 [Linnemannia elongata]